VTENIQKRIKVKQDTSRERERPNERSEGVGDRYIMCILLQYVPRIKTMDCMYVDDMETGRRKTTIKAKRPIGEDMY